jgi:hypothetical protein
VVVVAAGVVLPVVVVVSSPDAQLARAATSIEASRRALRIFFMGNISLRKNIFAHTLVLDLL